MKKNPKSITVEQMMCNVKAGDVIAFSGDTPVSKLIKYVTRSNVSHVGIVVEPCDVCDHCGSKKQLFEAHYSGVATSCLKCRIEKAIEDDVTVRAIWWLPLRKKLNHRQLKGLNEFLHEYNHREYDYLQAMQSAFDKFDPNAFTYATEDFDKLFCSELVAAAFEQIGVIKKINASEVTPIDICRLKVYTRRYYQLKGPYEKISGRKKII